MSLRKNWWRIAGLLALPSCMVSFNDYPVGPLGTKPDGGTDAGGKSAAGTSSVAAGTESGGSVMTGGTVGATSGTGGASGGTSPSGGMGAVAGTAGADTGGTSIAGSGGTSPDMTGGAASDGGAPSVESGMIDDFEDGDGSILLISGRSGAWYASNDGTGPQTPKPGMSLVPADLNPPRDLSTRAARTTGGPFNTWGALIGTAFSVKNNAASPYDVSAYQGVRFWVKNVSNAWNAAKKLRVSIPMSGTVPNTGCSVCNDHFTAEVDLFANWTQVSIPFSSFKQQGYGKPLLGTPDLKHLIFLEFAVTAHLSFDYYIDDVELY